MNIHPLWIICILTRLSLIFIIRFLHKKNRIILCSILFIIGLGFINKGFFGSNSEFQIAKVFWHETRYVHGINYILASYYLFNNNLNMNSLLLFSDLLFSMLYLLLRLGCFGT